MWVDETVLAPLRERYGTPRLLELELEISRAERELVGTSTSKRRHHDVTFFVFDPRERLALIQKPSYPEGVWRPPGGGVRPGERLNEILFAAEEPAVEILAPQPILE